MHKPIDQTFAQSFQPHTLFGNKSTKGFKIKSFVENLKSLFYIVWIVCVFTNFEVGFL